MNHFLDPDRAAFQRANPFQTKVQAMSIPNKTIFVGSPINCSIPNIRSNDNNKIKKGKVIKRYFL